MNNKQSTFLKILVGYWDIREWAFKDILFQFEFLMGVDFLFHVETYQTWKAIGATRLRRSIVRLALKVCFLIVHSFSNRFQIVGSSLILGSAYVEVDTSDRCGNPLRWVKNNARLHAIYVAPRHPGVHVLKII